MDFKLGFHEELFIKKRIKEWGPEPEKQVYVCEGVDSGWVSVIGLQLAKINNLVFYNMAGYLEMTIIGCSK